MRSMGVVLGLVIHLGVTGPLAAQDDHLVAPDLVSIEDRKGFNPAFAEIVQGDPVKGAEMMIELRERWSSDPDVYILDYNVACAYSKAGDLARASEWLRRSIEGGYGLFGVQLKTLETDVDLAPLRATEEWKAIHDDAARRLEVLQSGWDQSRQPFVWTPPPPARPADAPVAWEPPAPGILIVLHPYATDPKQFALDHFQEVARQQNLILFAPVGEELVSPGRWAWTSGPGDFLGSYSFINQEIWSLLRSLRRDQRHDSQRIFAVGLGQGGSLAFAIASRNPQWCSGAVVIGAPLAPSILRDWFRPAVHYGRRIVALHGKSDRVVPHGRVAAYVELCRSKGLDYQLQEFDGGRGLPSEFSRRLTEALEWMQAKPLVTVRAPNDIMLEPGEAPLLPEKEGTPEGEDR